MVSNLSTIGFVFRDDAAFQETMSRLSSEAFERLACDPGDYAIWRSRTGGEVWFHITGDREPSGHLKDRDVIGLTPFFEGLSDVPLEIVEAVSRTGDNEFEGSFLAWVNPDVDSGLGAHQIVFDSVDFAAHSSRPMPFLARAKLTGFAREIMVLDQSDQVAMERAASSARSFMATGLFQQSSSAAGGERPEPPSSNALLTGHIAEHSVLENEATGAKFHWMLVRTVDATFDIISDPEVVPAGVSAGIMVQVSCLFFGRISG